MNFYKEKIQLCFFNQAKAWVSILTSLIFIALPTVLSAIFQEYPKSLLPSIYNTSPGVILCLLLFLIKSPVLYCISIAWTLWFFVGIFNVLSSALYFGSYYSNLDISEASSIYLVSSIFYVFGIFISQEITQNTNQMKEESQPRPSKFNTLSEKILITFPFFWILSIYLTLGYIPILSGISIVDEIYELNYGPLYPYTIIFLPSLSYMFYRLINNTISRWFYVYFIAAFLISFADGKRVVAISTIFSILPILFGKYGESAWKKIAIGMFFVLISYVAVSIIRDGGGDGRYDDHLAIFTAVGVEFRDFVYSVNIFSPTNIPNYAWFTSGISSFINGGILNLLGLDKQQLVTTGSAYIWSELFGSPFGIRTGIVSELWFAYKWYGLIVIFIFGFLTNIVVAVAQKSKTENSYIFFIGVFGLLSLSIFGQTTAITGSITVLLYFYIFSLAEDFILKKCNYQSDVEPRL